MSLDLRNILYFFINYLEKKAAFLQTIVFDLYHYWFIVTRVLVINLSSKESYCSYQHNYMCKVI